MGVFVIVEKIFELILDFIFLLFSDEFFQFINFFHFHLQLCQLLHTLFSKIKISEYFVKGFLQLGSDLLFDFFHAINVTVYRKGKSTMIEFDYHKLLNNRRIYFYFLGFKKSHKILCLLISLLNHFWFLFIAILLLWLVKFIFIALFFSFIYKLLLGWLLVEL